jgi:hypothetical protein
LTWRRLTLPTQVIDAKTPQAMVKVEGEDIRVDARYVFPDLPALFSDFSD